MVRRCFLILLAIATVPAARSAEILSVEVDNDAGVYTMTSEVWFDAAIEKIYRVYRSWDYSTEFSSAIVESRDMAPDERGRAQYYIRHEGCVLFFCRSFERQGYIESEPNSTLRAFANPELSDFHLSNESWEFVAHKGGTIVTYDLIMRPKFWIPPGIGPYMIKRKLRKNGGDAVDRIELIAQRLDDE